MNPGDNVASPRSITCAPAGTGKLLPESTILSPCTMTTPFVMSAFDLPSNRRAAFSAMTGGASFPAPRELASDTKNKEKTAIATRSPRRNIPAYRKARPDRQSECTALLWVPQFTHAFREPLSRRGEAGIDCERLPEGSNSALVLIE